MHEGVSDILVARAREFDGVSRSVSASFAVHAAILLTIAVLPSAWFASKAPDKLMVISLGAGAVGPNPNGLTALGGKKVEEVAPPKARPEPIVPTAPKSTAMAEPLKTPAKSQPPAKTAAPPVQQAPPATKPATGAQITQGNAVAATTATGLGVGLSTGGQGGTALDSSWCCPDWINFLQTHVNWNTNLGIAGVVEVQFVVLRDGTITDAHVTKRSGSALLDIDAQRAVQTAKLLPLPAAYEPNRLTITLTFPYTR